MARNCICWTVQQMWLATLHFKEEVSNYEASVGNIYLLIHPPMHTHTHNFCKEEEMLKKILNKEKTLLTVWSSVILSLEYYLFSQSFKTFITLREAELYLSLQGLVWGLPLGLLGLFFLLEMFPLDFIGGKNIFCHFQSYFLFVYVSK